jgi:amidohydrolase
LNTDLNHVCLSIIIRGYLKMKTAFRAEFSTKGSAKPINIAICWFVSPFFVLLFFLFISFTQLHSEYDALPTIGHGCGHNLIAACGVATAIGIKKALEIASLTQPVTVVVLGCPAEEEGGGKINLIKGGAFEEIDLALMAHPVNMQEASIYVRTLAVIDVTVVFSGKSAHASSDPWDGVSALNALIACFSSVGLMRHQMRPDERLAGIITEGGVRSNMIPDRTAAVFEVRAPTAVAMRALLAKLECVIDSSAKAHGCGVTKEV